MHAVKKIPIFAALVIKLLLFKRSERIADKLFKHWMIVLKSFSRFSEKLNYPVIQKRHFIRSPEC